MQYMTLFRYCIVNLLSPHISFCLAVSSSLFDDPSIESEIGSDCSTKSGGLKHAKHVRFVELYTSKSYSDQKSKLVAPSKKLTDRLFKKSGGRQAFLYDDEDEDDPILNDEEARDVEKHKLSPKLVDAISYSSQVVWANCQKTEGLLGRSDMRLQTAVGMPIAMDGRGHMCVVVMFSPNNISSNDDAMDYLQFLRRTALSTSIPCLLPALPQGQGGLVKSSYIPINIPSSTVVRSEDFGDGVIARFVSFNDKSCDKAKEVRRPWRSFVLKNWFQSLTRSICLFPTRNVMLEMRPRTALAFLCYLHMLRLDSTVIYSDLTRLSRKVVQRRLMRHHTEFGLQ